MAQYIAEVKASARKSDEVKHLVGKKVAVYPETAKPIPTINDTQFKVVPLDAKGDHLKRDVRICASHLHPLDEKTAEVLKPQTST